MTPEKLAIKRATAEMIKGVGGLEASAGLCRVGKSTLGDNQSVNHDDSFVALDVVLDLEPLTRERAGWPHITRLMCRNNGGAFVALPDPQGLGDDLNACAARHAKEASEVTARLFDAMGNGQITAAKISKHDLLREAREAIEASVQLQAMLEAIAEAEA
ncbi:hypothetical protein DFR49_3386 [Hephaestia caeni]|uniref:Phage regulatory protein CII n=1 Tax=Hephaestia caeni TaxID=645617 RepID=A0A397NVS5_9SPHN|nr:hypothetical protein [Hephaestia caeni]RIA37501.1 hypothetical protein DFR49_3386 [Hephaestia caeni]